MDSGSGETRPTLWLGRAASALAALALIADGALSLLAPGQLAAESEASGFPMAMVPVVGVITLVCGVFYAIPQTAVLGAILATGFLGGAIAIHVRLGELGSPPQFICLAIGALAWLGLYLREPRLRALLPLRS